MQFHDNREIRRGQSNTPKATFLTIFSYLYYVAVASDIEYCVYMFRFWGIILLRRSSESIISVDQLLSNGQGGREKFWAGLPRFIVLSVKGPKTLVTD